MYVELCAFKKFHVFSKFFIRLFVVSNSDLVLVDYVGVA